METQGISAASLRAQRIYKNNNDNVSRSLQRLSTGLRINSGSDDPAGLVASETLRAERAGIESALSNAGRAASVVGTAEGGLGEIAGYLVELQDLVKTAANSGGLSGDELNAVQGQADSLLQEINRVSNATTFGGKRLLNGSLDYSLSGVATANLQNLKVNSAKLPGGTAQNVVVAVTQSAQTARLGYAGGALTALNTVTLEVAGSLGTEQVTIAGGTTVAGIITAINSVKTSTGASAALSGANLRVDSQKFGSDQFVSLKALAGTFAPTVGKAVGRDAAVTVNSVAASARGSAVTSRSSNIELEFSLSTAFNVVGTTTFNITGGGAAFALGAKVLDQDRAAIGISSVAVANLGDQVNGFLSSISSGGANQLTGVNVAKAQTVVDSAIKQVSTLRGRLGNFQRYQVEGSANALAVTLENISAAESAIRETDFAAETARLTRSQILSSASTSLLAQTNSRQQQVLELLRG